MLHSLDPDEWETNKTTPNYYINKDLEYPYSECPFLGKYKLIKIPETGLVEHIDYWGEGRIESYIADSGFPDCYNVNHQYKLVSNGGPGVEDRKIANRIPVETFDDCNTQSYVEHNSVKIVTLMSAPINESCASDIARMINDEKGLVVIYDLNRDAQDIKNLDKTLNPRNLVYCPGYELPKKLRNASFTRHVAFVNLTEYGDILYRSIVDAEYDRAISLCEELTKANHGGLVSDALEKMPRGDELHVKFARSLKTRGCDDIVTTHFPSEFHNF